MTSKRFLRECFQGLQFVVILFLGGFALIGLLAIWQEQKLSKVPELQEAWRAYNLRCWGEPVYDDSGNRVPQTIKPECR